jgi:WXG100 family type VII secretion target
MLFHVEISQLKEAANKLKSAVEEYGNATQATKAAADTVAAGWEGEAQEAFVDEQAQAVQWYQAVATAVNVYIAAINAAAAVYQQLDIEGVNIIS